MKTVTYVYPPRHREIAKERKKEIGHSQYNDFVDKRLVNRTVKLTAPLKRNNLAVFVKRKTTQATTSNKLNAPLLLKKGGLRPCQ